MRIDVLFTPAQVTATNIANRAVAVFDVLRATTTMTAALAAGVSEIRIFESTDAAKDAAQSFHPPPLLCGERNCLPPPGFDLGNSPGGFQTKLHAHRTVFMSTTNGTRAIIAAKDAKFIFAAALVNASAVAASLIATGLDITLLCAGTNGERAPEDLLGAGAVLNAISKTRTFEADSDRVAEALAWFRESRNDLPATMQETTGGKNVTAVGLSADLAFAAQLDAIPVVGRVLQSPLRVII